MKTIESLMKLYNTSHVRKHYCTLYFDYNLKELGNNIRDSILITTNKFDISKLEIEGGLFEDNLSSFSVTLELYTLTDNLENLVKRVDKIGDEIYNKLKKEYNLITMKKFSIYGDTYTEYLTLQDILEEDTNVQKEIVRSLNKEYRLR